MACHVCDIIINLFPLTYCVAGVDVGVGLEVLQDLLQVAAAGSAQERSIVLVLEIKIGRIS